MSAKLSILKESLKKKEVELERRFGAYFDSVNQANGQPLNDKRGGQAVMDGWDRKSDAIRNQKAEIEKTKAAIEREESKISNVYFWYHKMPKILTDLIDDGVLIQWRKHPRIMFVAGVDKARIVFSDDTGVITHRYAKSIPNEEQYLIFKGVYNRINAEQKKT